MPDEYDAMAASLVRLANLAFSGGIDRERYLRLESEFADALRQAAADARERAAVIADQHWDRHARDCANHAGPCFREIAAAIRKGKVPGEGFAMHRAFFDSMRCALF